MVRAVVARAKVMLAVVQQSLALQAGVAQGGLPPIMWPLMAVCIAGSWRLIFFFLVNCFCHGDCRRGLIPLGLLPVFATPVLLLLLLRRRGLGLCAR